MGRISLITGGCRSGKSHYAEDLLASYGNHATYLATCPILDDEMRQRINRHKKDRAKRNWNTVEECINIDKALESINTPVLIDCLTLWLNNLIYQAQINKMDFGEDDIILPTQKLIEVMQKRESPTILVTNEVGLGIVPENKLSRIYRDCNGRISQQIAKIADDVTLLVAGIPMAIKGSII